MTGMRRGEVLGLRWSDVDLAGSRLAVRQTLVAVGYEVRTSTPKNNRARSIDLDTDTVQALRSHRQQQAQQRQELNGKHSELDLVVTRPTGEPVHPHALSQAFQASVKSAGLPRIRFHDVRHTHASLGLVVAPVHVISERLGHSSPAFTLQQYAHVVPGMHADAAQRIAALVRSAHEPHRSRMPGDSETAIGAQFWDDLPGDVASAEH
jgi:integrase